MAGSELESVSNDFNTMDWTMNLTGAEETSDKSSDCNETRGSSVCSDKLTGEYRQKLEGEERSMSCF